MGKLIRRGCGRRKGTGDRAGLVVVGGPLHPLGDYADAADVVVASSVAVVARETREGVSRFDAPGGADEGVPADALRNQR